jgi:PTH1 family peptidyl-tRNA hydrolase
MKVVMGLGNPGSRYARTRHNLGFMVVDDLGRNIRSKPVSSAVPARLSRGSVVTAEGEEAVFLVQPTTYMNHSGQALESLAKSGDAGNFSAADLLVVYDDVFLPFGRLRLKGSGSAGGHNGLKSVLQTLGTTEVPRLRCGVGPLPPGADLVEYVLEEFTPDEARTLPEFVGRAALAARTYLEKGLSAALNRFNPMEIEGAES